jgi:hypothetical protein
VRGQRRLVACSLAVEIAATLHPIRGRNVVCVDSHVPGVTTRAVVLKGADGQHCAVCTQGDKSTALIADRFAFDWCAVKLPAGGVGGVVLEDTHAATIGISPARADGQDGAVRTERNGPTEKIALRRAVNVCPASHPVGSTEVPRVHPGLSSACAGVRVAKCTDGQDVAVGAEGNRAAAEVAPPFAVDI